MVNHYDISSVKVVFSCSSALENIPRNRLYKRFHIPAIIQGYGMSELATISDQTDDNQKEGSVGMLRRGLYGKVVNTKTGETLAPNQRGELQFKGPCLMNGYRFNDDATRNAIDENGWLHTGDFGYYDEDNEWFIVDRIKDLIHFRNQIISPSEIENVLKEHPNIIEAAVIGMQINNENDTPIAFILTNSIHITKTQIINYVNGMDKFKLISVIPG